MNGLVSKTSKIVAEEYDGLAQAWDRYFVPATARAREHMIQLARLKTGERVLDIGTGTGSSAIIAAQMVGKTGRVLGIDVSRMMVKKAQRRAARLHQENLEFRVMDSTSLTLPDKSFNAIITSFGTPEGLYDAQTVLKRWFRILAPQGRLCFCEGGDRKVFQIIDRIVSKYKVASPTRELAARRKLKTLLEAEKKHHHLLDLSNIRRLRGQMHHAGFKKVKISKRGLSWTFSNSRTLLNLFLSSDFSHEYGAMTPNAQHAFRAEFLSALKPFESSKGLTLGDTVTFLRADKNGTQLTRHLP